MDNYSSFPDDYISELNKDLIEVYENNDENLFIQRIINQGKFIQNTYNEIKTNLSENILVFMFNYTPCKNCDISKFVMEKYAYKYFLLDNIFPYDTSKNYYVIFKESDIFYASVFRIVNSYKIYERGINDIVSFVKYKDSYMGNILYFLLKNNYGYNLVDSMNEYRNIYYLKDKLSGIKSITFLWGAVLSVSYNMHEYNFNKKILETSDLKEVRLIISYIKEVSNINDELKLFMYLREYILYPIQKYFEETQSIFEKHNMLYGTKESKKERSTIYSKLVKEKKVKSKWKNEQLLFRMISKFFNDAIYQYYDGWLERQTLDIYIPSLKLGIEYQGEQHFKEVTFFGGEEGLEKTKERDMKKKKLCEKNGVNLMYWNYFEPINTINLREKLSLFGLDIL